MKGNNLLWLLLGAGGVAAYFIWQKSQAATAPLLAPPPPGGTLTWTGGGGGITGGMVFTPEQIAAIGSSRGSWLSTPATDLTAPRPLSVDGFGDPDGIFDAP